MFYRSRKQLLPLKEEYYIDDKQEEERDEYIFAHIPKVEKNIIEMLSQGFSYAEIAAKIKKPLNTVKSIIRRARLKIKKTNQKL